MPSMQHLDIKPQLQLLISYRTLHINTFGNTSNYLDNTRANLTYQYCINKAMFTKGPATILWRQGGTRVKSV